MVQLCQRMLCDHGIFHLDLLQRSLKERLFMSAKMEKESKEIKRR